MTQGMVAIIDDEDYDIVREFNWHAVYIRNKWYAARYHDGSTQYMHSFLTIFPQVDHRNGNGLDNRKSNLRDATTAENQHNSSKPRHNTSGYKGVHWDKERSLWRAAIHVQKRCIFLGRFIDPMEAAKAYDEAALKYFGDFANLNFKKGG